MHGLDDRLESYRVEAVQPPAITAMNVEVRYSDYLRTEGSGAVDRETEYKAGLRISEGSDVTLVANSSTPLGDADVMLKTDAGESVPNGVSYSDDRRQMRLELNDFKNATTVRIVPRDQNGISAQAAYRYFMGVVLDEPPEVELRLKGVGSAVTAIARIPVELVAKDDYGVDRLWVKVAPSSDAEQSPKTAGSEPELDREGNASIVMDVRDLVTDGELDELEPGGAISVYAEASDRYDLGATHLTRSELFRLRVVTPEALLALLERRELAMRARLEQTIDETRTLRDTLDQLRRRAFESPDEITDDDEAKRQIQVNRLRVQQSGLQASKTSDELSGIATALNDMLLEMVNNRVDSVDRRERISTGVRDPLKKIVEDPLARLIAQLEQVEQSVDKPAQAAEKTAVAVQQAEEVLLQLTAVLEKMLDLESYNEILDIVRGLIDDQEELSEETKEEQRRSLRELFE